MINRNKLVALSLLTALIVTLVLASLNVTSVGANPGTTMTFDSNLTMEFEIGDECWVSSGKYLYVYNETKGENITELGPGTTLMAEAKPGWGYPAPEAGDWYYVYGELYGAYVAFQIDQVWGPAGAPTFNITKTWDHWLRTPRNWTGDNDFSETPVTTFEAEGMLSSLEVGVEYWSFDDNFRLYNWTPAVGQHWAITYHDALYNTRFNISSVGSGFREADGGYYPIEFGALWNSAGDRVSSVAVPPTAYGPCPVEGVGGPQLTMELETTQKYYITHTGNPSPLLPENSTWWNVTSPAEMIGTRFEVKNSYKVPYMGILRSYMDLNTITGPNSVSAPGVESIEAIWTDAPQVGALGSWYNVIDGPTPPPHTWWNTTTSDPLNTSLVDVQFYIDASGEGVFHIDETSGDVTVSPAVDNVTAEELTPALYVYSAIDLVNLTLTPGKNFTISIETNYTMNIWGYEFTLEWNPLVLNVTAVTNASTFLTGASFIPGTIDNVAGELSLTGASFDELTTQTPGPGTLANVNFTVVDTGDSDITLGSRVIKITSLGEEQNVVDDVTGLIVNGYFSNVGVVTHDAVVISIETSVSEEYQSVDAPLVQINVTVKNQGTLAETGIEVKVYYDNPVAGNLIGTGTVDLGVGADDTLTFNWNISNVLPRNRTIVAKAVLAFGVDANPADNLLIGPDVHVKILGNICGDEVWLPADGDVDFNDFNKFGGKYGTQKPNPIYDASCDLNYDDAIGFDDFIIFAGNYGMYE